MSRCIKGLCSITQRRRRFEQTLTELQRYSDRELYELGISPVDIRSIAREVARAVPK